MENTKHTPGPYRVTKVQERGKPKTYNVRGEDGTLMGELVAVCANDANARLIAAAPELLDIARAYHNLLRTMAHTDGEVSTFEHIGEVIAKATGQQ